MLRRNPASLNDIFVRGAKSFCWPGNSNGMIFIDMTGCTSCSDYSKTMPNSKSSNEMQQRCAIADEFRLLQNHAELEHE